MKSLIALTALAFTPISPAYAAIQTVTLSVPGMTCATCPITVKRALTKVDGVQKVEVSYDTRETTVTFDDTKTQVETLTTATANAGYPSHIKQ